MSLNTLLEAARFIELQEQQQLRNRSETPISSSTISSTSSSSASSPEAAAVVSPPAPPPPPRLPTIPLAQQNSTSLSNSIITTPVLPPQFTLKDVCALTVPQPRPPPPQQQQQAPRIIHNSFDIINPLVIDEVSGEQKRKQPPMVFRSGTREVHNKLEKHRRAHLKECFDMLKKQLPASADEKKTSNLSILHAALRHIQLLKRRERDLEHEMERLAREKISAQQRLVVLKKEISAKYDGLDFSRLLPDVPTTPVVPVRPSPEPSPQPQEPVVATVPAITTLGGGGGGGNHFLVQHEGNERVPISPLPRQHQSLQFLNGTKEVQQQQQPVQTTTLSVLPVSYPVNQGLVLQKVALVPKGITELSPLVSSPAVAHFITAPQQLNGKVVPLVNVNAQYVVKPVVVVSTASRTS